MDVQKILGDEASYLLEHTAEAIPAKLLTTPGPDFVTEIFSETDRSPQVMRLSLIHISEPTRPY